MISSDEVCFDRRYVTEIRLRYDPSDSQYPFKGTSTKMGGYDYKLQKE